MSESTKALIRIAESLEEILRLVKKDQKTMQRDKEKGMVNNESTS
jgi:hypothetical protein